MKKLIKFIRDLFKKAKYRSFKSEKQTGINTHTNRTYQIGKNAQGIWFHPESSAGTVLGWSPEMLEVIGKEGEIVSYIHEQECYGVYFPEQERIFYYPAELVPIEQYTKGKRGCTIKK